MDESHPVERYGAWDNLYYIRFLRYPVLSCSPPATLSVVLAITNDLGDTLFVPGRPQYLSILFRDDRDPVCPRDHVVPISPPSRLCWQAGMRVLKMAVPIPAAVACLSEVGAALHLCIAASLNPLVNLVDLVDETMSLASSSSAPTIVPAWAVFSTGPSELVAERTERRFRLRRSDKTDAIVRIEEDLGESIARRVWDGGIAAVAFLHSLPSFGLAVPFTARQPMPILESIFASALAQSPGRRALNWLELGCGLGMVGLGLAHLLSRAARHAPPHLDQDHHLVLMTDLPEAEERVKANIMLFSPDPASSASVAVAYAPLDWATGARGELPDAVRDRPWPLILLSDCTYNQDAFSDLIGTLSAVHAANETHLVNAEAVTRLFLVRKRRHPSEHAFFHSVAQAGWRMRERHVLSGRVTGPATPDYIELYLFEKASGIGCGESDYWVDVYNGSRTSTLECIFQFLA